MTIDSQPDTHRSGIGEQENTGGSQDRPEPAGETPTPPSTDLAVLPAHPTALRRLMLRYQGPRNFDDQLRQAARLARSRHVMPPAYQNQDELLALMQHAMALDIDLAIAWQNLYFSDQGSGMRAMLMHALAIRAGHKVIPLEVSSTSVSMMLRRGDGGTSGGAQFTVLEAQTAGLLDQSDKLATWTRFTEDSLWARCLSRVVRRYAPEVVLGFYEASELDAPPVNDVLEPDMVGVETDADGNWLPALDVQELLGDLDPNGSLMDIRRLWQKASDQGLLTRYAGVVGEVRMTVHELLYDHGNRAQAREEAAARREAVEKAAAETAAATTPAAPEDPPAPARATKKTTSGAKTTRRRKAKPADDTGSVTDAPAGTPGLLPCGCDAAVAVTSGEHKPDCAHRAAR